MKNFNDNFVNTSQHTDESFVNDYNISSENVDEDPLGSLGVGVHEPSYYKLDRVVFAEPIEDVATTNGKESGAEKEELTFIDNVVVKKRPGRSNKYIMDVIDGCLTCPQPKCHQTLSSTTLLKAHIRKVHCATTKYMCETCGAGFTAPYLLKRHLVVHTGQRVQCTVCGKWLSERTNLSVHLRTHGASKPHACALCGKRFLRAASLTRHVSCVHRERSLTCDVCNKRTLCVQNRLARYELNKHKACKKLASNEKYLHYKYSNPRFDRIFFGETAIPRN